MNGTAPAPPSTHDAIIAWLRVRDIAAPIAPLVSTTCNNNPLPTAGQREAPLDLRRKLGFWLERLRTPQDLCRATGHKITEIQVALRHLAMDRLVRGNDREGYRLTRKGKRAFAVNDPSGDRPRPASDHKPRIPEHGPITACTQTPSVETSPDIPSQIECRDRESTASLIMPVVDKSPTAGPIPDTTAWVRPQPIRDSIIAYLSKPRFVRDIARHINRPVPTTTGHLAAMRRRGLVKRIGLGVYAPVNWDETRPVPAPKPMWRKAPPAVRRRLVLLLTQHRDVQALSCETRLSTTRVRAALHELWMSGLISGNDGDGYRVTAAGRYAYFIRAPENDAITAHAVRKCPA